MRTRMSLVGLLGFGMAMAACGDATPPPPPALLTIAKADPSGNEQVGSPNFALPQQLRARVFEDGVPKSGVTVAWATADGQVTGSTTSDADGIVTATWTLGPSSGARLAQASATIEENDRVTSFTAYSIPGDHALVEIQNNVFVPSAITVPPNTPVTWLWRSTATGHNVAPAAGGTQPTRSGPPRDGPFLYSFTFTNEGVYDYICEPHLSDGMTGRVTVQVAPPAPPTR
ncbi:MAG: plastocyanin/azurin family copper-binding protein [Gemmatimonadota bacterium]|nr:plastocyanin/azurin family copper-binding protein [Gemmatimonadota bacterium]